MTDVFLYQGESSSQDVSLRDPTTTNAAAAYVLAGSAGTYAVTGQAGTFGVARNLGGAAGNYSINGQSGALAVARKLAGAVGSYTLSGQTGAFGVRRILGGASGSYGISGQSGAFLVGRKLPASAGSITLSGWAAALNYTPGGGGGFAYVLAGAKGSVTLVGQAARLFYFPGNLKESLVPRIILDGKLVGETLNETFDFLSRLAIGETISTATVTASVYSGTDAAPSAIVSGSAAISGSKVTQKITAGTLGVVYKLLCVCTTSTSQTLSLAALLAVVPDTE